ncbi:MAG: S8 family serine peptidase [Meiothermus sp.]|nr:S8 family serine peptidase [Meiothermus sp.]
MSWTNRKWVFAGLLAALLGACTTPSAPPNTLSGSVRLNLGGSGLSLPVLSTLERPTESTEIGWVPGEVIVKFRPGVSLQRLERLNAGGLELQRVRRLALENVELYRASASASVEAVARGLAARADVEWAQPNYLLRATATPNDPAYVAQWHYPAINMAQAWDAERGISNPVTVAVIDTGVLVRHPDLQGKVLPGYDFISDPRNSNDGDGRDPNADDPGDAPGEQSSYHGSHVGGTVAATTDNGAGVAGVSWGARILPVRVLGVQGGTVADIADSLVWAAGGAVQGVPANPNPAQVINMSLGGPRPCRDTPAYQEAINVAVGRGSIVVVAAGNSNQDTAGFTPASCSSVITVGATQFSGQRARYSNFGKRIDLMAPGGDVRADLNGDNYPDGVLSLGKNDQNGEFVYAFENGTSMAAPHVAGVIALMKSRDPSLNAARALDILRRTARPLTAAACTGQGPAQTPSDCGAGLIDAAAALQALGGSSPGPGPQPDFSLSLNPNSLSLRPGSSATVNLTVTGSGGFSGPVNFALSGQPSGVVGTFANGRLTLTTSPNLAAGSYALIVQGQGGGLSRSATLTLTVSSGSGSRPSVQGTFVLACFYLGNDCDSVKSRITQAVGSGTLASYGFTELAVGEYLMIAWKDSDGNEDINDGDFLGVYTQNGNAALVRPGSRNLDIPMEMVVSTNSDAARRLKTFLR